MEETGLKRIMLIIILGVLFLLSYFLLKPILMSIIWGIVFAFIFSPVYNFLLRKIKSRNLSSLIICVFLLLIILVPTILLTPTLINQSIKIYVASQQLDFVSLFQKIFPSLFVSQEFSLSVANTIGSFITKTTDSLMNSF